MNRSRKANSGSLGTVFTLSICVMVIVISARWAFQSDPQDASSADSASGVLIAATPAVDPLQTAPFPNHILAVSLNDDLFPEAVPEQSSPPPKAPRLAVDLIAITYVDGARSIFGFDRASGEYFTADVGDSIPSGPTVVVIEEQAVVFDVAGRQTRLELAP